MPNWCYTIYRISCREDSKKAIVEAIKSLEDEQTENNRIYSDERRRLEEQGLPGSAVLEALNSKGLFYRSTDVWLYYLLLKLGYSEEFLKGYPGNMRGYIYEMQDEGGDGWLNLHCDTAWREADAFRELLKDKFSDDETFAVYFTAEEPGCEYFVTNDPDYDGTFIVDIEDEGAEYESEHDVIDIVNDRLGTDAKTLDEAVAAALRHNDLIDGDGDKDSNVGHIWINRFEYFDC